jgi:cell division protease FtsH
MTNPGDRGSPGPGERPRPRPKWQRWLLPLGLLLVVAILVGPSVFGSRSDRLNYTEFLNAVNAGQVRDVTISSSGAVNGNMTNGHHFTTQLPIPLGAGNLPQALSDHNVTINATGSGSPWWSVLLSFAPLLLLVAFFVWTGRRAMKGMGGGMGGLGGISGFGRSRTKVVDTERPTTRFADVAGYAGAKQEIEEVVDYLRDPHRYQAVGATGPRGVLLVGPPGTGKTLLARAVAGEASVPFLSVSGSGFVEMFVGVGASRVRDLFMDARGRAPAIIFIDEIDAIGSRRTSASVGGNDEREQTLNQLLAEMDGFEQSPGVVIIAATNRPDTLDVALLRPGRFDRQVVVGLPTQDDRSKILAVHAKGKPLSGDVDLAVVARATPGFSGADLANLVNEAAIHAVRARRMVITMDDLDAARDRIMLGRREDSNVLLPEEKITVAVHEAGHAIVAALSPHADPVSKVTILPAGMALGATQQLPESERHLYGEAYLHDVLAIRLGGRAAERAVFGEASTGATDDLAGATSIAVRMVREFGLSDLIGPVGYGDGSPNFLPPTPDATPRPYSENTQQRIDSEVKRLLQEAEQRALQLLRSHRPALDRLTEKLLERETVDGSVVRAALTDGDSGDPGTSMR